MSKLAEARFFLSEMKRTQLVSMEFRYYSSACASALYSSYNHLLFDYAKKFWPTITPNEYIDEHLVSLLASATNHPAAKDFVQWYSKLYNRMQANPDTKAALNVRTMEIHRSTAPLFVKVAVFDTLDISDRIEYGIMNSQGTITPSGTQIPTPKQLQTAGQGSRPVVFFSSYKTMEAADTLNAAIDFVESLIKEAESRFGPA